MSEAYVIADTHFNHGGLLKNSGSSRGARFSSLTEMNEAMLDGWADTVRPRDTVYHLGDVAFAQQTAPIWKQIKKLPGQKGLLLGNHDRLSHAFYATMFHLMASAIPWKHGIIFSHVPLHGTCLGGKNGKGWRYNIHGHIHDRLIQDDSRYFNACVEHIDYRPYPLDLVKQYFTTKVSVDPTGPWPGPGV